MQKNDVSLNEFFDIATTGKSVKSGIMTTVPHAILHNILYRFYMANNGTEIKQLMIPTE